MKNRRRAFLIDSNQTSRRTPNRIRNRFLNFFIQILFIKQLVKLFKGSVLVGIFFGIIACFIGFSFFSPYFELKKISVLRDNPNIDANLVESSLKDFFGTNMLILPKNDIKKTLTKKFPEFQNISITEHWPDEIKLKIENSPPLITLLNQETANFSVVSHSGIILKEMPDESLPTVKIFDYLKPIFPHQKFAEPELLKKILEVKNLFESQIELVVNDIHYYPVAKEVHIISKNDMAIWFDLQFSIEQQIRKLKSSTSRIGLYEDRNIDHIDLRIPKQIFWKDQ